MKRAEPVPARLFEGVLNALILMTSVAALVAFVMEELLA